MIKKILITGGTGFAGSHLIEHLSRTQTEVELHSTSYHTVGSYVTTHFPQVIQHSLDLADREAVFQLLATLQPDEIYHLASLAVVGTSFDQVQEVLTNNVTLHLNLLEAIKRHAPRARLLSIGSAEGYGATKLPPLTPLSEEVVPRPTNPYAISKLTQEMLSLFYERSYGMNVVCVRPFNHIGERQTPNFVVSAFASQIAQIEQGKQDVLQVGNLSSIRDFTDVRDMVAGYSLLMSKGVSGEIYNLGIGKGYKIQDILDTLLSLSTTSIRVVNDPERSRPSDTPWLIADVTKALNLGWQPQIPLPETLSRVLEYWRTQQPI